MLVELDSTSSLFVETAVEERRREVVRRIRFDLTTSESKGSLPAPNREDFRI